ncbi:2-hydroxychromene-2-carboxylate isomerase [Micromonospora rifamycinica]|uniref:2-hydroxychromene-2-carboxylate isomerase n=1 Tax=Micromonospora rifamycinica TaxID=291594 RepID=A0A125Q197_9ACTN|nr:DsbA family protein [Micromonospora rifamycinica]KWV31462.1 disulfide bond formation protein DsbA [Micromonospora rifamycinica]SCG48345.1 2-hydroxychromene-2-carboxylate isomerase [Micromonospora rifamycinica]
MTRAPARPRLFFSFRSPYSWLTVRRLRATVPTAFTDFDWFPYWDPDARTAEALAARGAEFHYVQMSRAKHLYLLMDTKRLVQREGVPMAWPIDVDPHWEVPHLGWLAARRAGRAAPFYDEVVAARWERGENICDPAVVAGCAERAGLEPALVTGAVDDPQLRDEGAGCLERAYLDDIFGIPYLKWGRHRFWGLDRLDGFLAVWRPDPAAAGSAPAAGGGSGAAATVAAAPAPAVAQEAVRLPDRAEAIVASGGYDTDTTGGCG